MRTATVSCARRRRAAPGGPRGPPGGPPQDMPGMGPGPGPGPGPMGMNPVRPQTLCCALRKQQLTVAEECAQFLQCVGSCTYLAIIFMALRSTL